jgi:branched-chain amino acid transport system permease protein
MNIATFTSKRFLVPGVLVLILVLLATVPLYISPGTRALLISFLMYIIMAVSWAMFSGPTGYISLGSAAFFGIGVYTSALLYAEGAPLLPLPAVIVIAGLAAFCCALIIGSATLRLRGIFFTMFSFGLLEAARPIIQYFEFETHGARGRYIESIGADNVYYLMLITFVAVMVTVYLLRRSRWGLAMQGIGENEEAAAHMGINTTMVKVITFGISGIFTGITGAIMAIAWKYADPSTAFNLNYSFLPLLMALVGGMGQLYGPVIGALGFAYLRYVLLSNAARYYMLIFGIIMILFILFLPGGLAGLIERGRHRLGEVIAKLRKGGEAGQHANT